MEVISLPSIALIVYWVVEIIKYAVNENEKFTRLIPVLTVALGAQLGGVAFYAAPQIIPAADLFSAIIIGGASGMSATGANQIYKQLSKYKNGDGNGNGKDKNGGNGKDNGKGAAEKERKNGSQNITKE
jgi:hypothetical protein